MTTAYTWLPPLVLFEDSGGNWDRYLEVLYEHFRADFVLSQPRFQGVSLRLKRHPLEKGKEATFWHLISEGKVEADRTIDPRRCERIRWPRPIIEGVPRECLLVWEQERRGETRIAIALSDFSYVVILAVREPSGGGKYLLPWTAFCVERDHKRQKLKKEWDAFKGARNATGAAP